MARSNRTRHSSKPATVKLPAPPTLEEKRHDLEERLRALFVRELGSSLGNRVTIKVGAYDEKTHEAQVGLEIPVTQREAERLFPLLSPKLFNPESSEEGFKISFVSESLEAEKPPSKTWAPGERKRRTKPKDGSPDSPDRSR